MEKIGDLIIILGVLIMLYGAYHGLKRNNIFMKNPSRKREDRANPGVGME